MEQEIIEKEFRTRLGIDPVTPVNVVFTEEETILVTFSGREFKMEIGSDDEDFRFVEAATGTVVEFPIFEDEE